MEDIFTDGTIDEPIPLHRFQILMARYQRVVNTLYDAKLEYQAAVALDDGMRKEAAVRQAKNALKEREILLPLLKEAWERMDASLRDNIAPTLPKGVQEALHAQG